MVYFLTLGDDLNNYLIEFQNEIRRTFYFMKEGFKNIKKRFEEADKYKKEFEYDLSLLERNIQKLKNQDNFAKRLRDIVQPINILSRLYEFANIQQEIAYRMAHVYMISIYEGFVKEVLSQLFINYQDLLVDAKNSLNTIKNMTQDDLNKLILKKTKYLANVENLEILLNHPNLKIDINNKFSKWNSFKENYYRRHVIVHKHGIYDGKYVIYTNMPNKLIGTEIKTDFAYIKELANNVCDIMGFLISQILSTFGLSISGKDIEDTAKDSIKRLKKHSNL